MSAHPVIDDPGLGPLSRATTTMSDGSTLTHDWYGGRVTVDGSTLDLMVEGTDPAGIAPLLPRVRETIDALPTLRRVATDAVIAAFSTGELQPHEFDAAAEDLELDTLEASADGTIVLHLIDSCGEHFPEGYWPAVHLGVDGTVTTVTVES